MPLVPLVVDVTRQQVVSSASISHIIQRLLLLRRVQSCIPPKNVIRIPNSICVFRAVALERSLVVRISHVPTWTVTCVPLRQLPLQVLGPAEAVLADERDQAQPQPTPEVRNGMNVVDRFEAVRAVLQQPVV